MNKLLVHILAIVAIGLLFGASDVFSQGFFSFNNRGNVGVYVDCGGQDCLRAGVQDAGVALGQTGIETEKNAVQAIQDLVKTFLTYISLIAVIYIIGAGVYLIIGSANDETITKVRKIIMYVILGIVIIWVAYWIVALVIGTLSGRQYVSQVRPAYAQTQIRSVDFESYANKIKGMQTAIRSSYDPDVMKELSTLIDGAYQHLPDGDEFFQNKNLYEGVKQRIAQYNESKQSLARGALEISLDDFFDEIYAPKIKGTIVASPDEGSAPLSVTLDARDMQDESGHVLGENNYIWWMKDTNTGPQVIGRGKTINHTFQTQGNYTVFLTVNSDSKNSKGFIDVISFEDSISIQVGQEDIRFYILFNDQLISLEDTVKIPTREAAAGIVIDASGTFIPDGYKILHSEWNFGNGQKSPTEGPPRVEYLTYAEGTYNLRLDIERNDGKQLTKRIKLIVGDPIANIYASKTLIHRGETVNFRANKLSSDNTSYSWEIREVGNPLPIHIDQGPILSYPFMKIGRYQVMLISEKFDGSRDQDTKTITVASQSPVAHFSYRSISSHLPNTLILDATRSYDPDLEDESSLTYSWFIDGTPVQLEKPERNNSIGAYTFDERGNYNITLSIRDAEGKITSTTKDVQIDSTLFLTLENEPLVAKRGEQINFTAKSSKEAKSFSWNFGDKGVDTTIDGTTSHTYNLAGKYGVSVVVQDDFGQENRLKKFIYVVDADEPLSIIDSNSGSIFSQVEDTGCNGESALVTDRLNGVFLSGERSVNSSGRNDDLTYFWRIGLNETSAQKRFEYIFDEVGCHEVQLTVTDIRNGKSHSSSEYVRVENLAPEFSDMTINIDNVDMDPMTIRLSLGGAEDPDGVIRSYTWYYFTDFDKNPQGFRVTTTPSTVFVLPKITGRYKFAVVLEDSNGLKIDSTDLNRGDFTTPDLFVNQNLSTPIIRFDVGKSELLLGEDSILTANVKNALGQEIDDRSEFRWDFDGDGFYDLKTEKNTTTYRYTLPGEYNPKVKVTHRGVSSSKHGNIRVENRLEPKIEAYVVGNTVIAQNSTTGVFKGVKWKHNNKIISDNKDYVVFTPDSFPVTLSLDVSDGRQEQSTSITLEKNFRNKARILKENQDLIAMVNTSSNPTEPWINPDDITLENPNDALFIYLGESTDDAHRYHIDIDAELDSDLNGDTEDDIDNRSSGSFTTGRPFRIPLGKKHKQEVLISLVDRQDQVIATHTIEITKNYIEAPIFNEPIDVVEIELTDQDKLRVNKLNQLIQNAPDEQQYQLGKFVEQLLDEWYDTTARADTLFRMHQYINENGQSSPELTAEIQRQIDAIYAQGQEDITDKELAKKLISDFIPKNHPEYVRIFGNTQTGEPGWIEQFIDDPAYAMDNYSFAEKIWKSVSFSTDITDEKKQVIYDKLGVLIGQPLDQVPDIEADKPNDVKNGEKGASDSSGRGFFGWLLLILSGLVFIALAIFGIRFVLSRISKGQNDPLGTLDDANPTPDAPVETSGGTPIPDPSDTLESTPSWLQESNEQEDTSQTPQNTDNSEVDQGTPDWLQESPQIPGSENEEASVDETPTPDWLKEAGESQNQEGGAENLTGNTETLKPGNIETESQELGSGSDDVNTPDWLKAAGENQGQGSGSENTTGDTETLKHGNIDVEKLELPTKGETSGSGDTNGVTEDVEQKAEITDTTEGAEVPDWLKVAGESQDQEGGSENLTGNTETLKHGNIETESQELGSGSDDVDTPDWLQDAGTKDVETLQHGNIEAEEGQVSDTETLKHGNVTEDQNQGQETGSGPQDLSGDTETLKHGNTETNKKNSSSTPKKDGYFAKDGTDLTKIPNIYAIVPHESGDHKLVFFEEDAPNDLLDDPKERKKGDFYKKGKMKIYAVHVLMKLHPDLKKKDGKPMDIWLIKDANDIEKQLKAIRSGKGGGTKFKDAHIVTHDENNGENNGAQEKGGEDVETLEPGNAQDQEGGSENLTGNTETLKYGNIETESQELGGDNEPGTPDWLQDAGTKDTETLKHGNIETETSELSTDETLKQGNDASGENTKPNTPQNSAGDDDADLPDWLKGDIDESATTQFTDDLKKMEEERQKEIDELKKKQAELEKEEKGSKGTEENEQGPENTETLKHGNTETETSELSTDETLKHGNIEAEEGQASDAETLKQGNDASGENTKPNTPQNSAGDDDADLPDWLKGDIDESATTQFTDDLKKMEEERQKEIDELKKKQAELEKEEKGSKGTEENEQGPENTETLKHGNTETETSELSTDETLKHGNIDVENKKEKSGSDEKKSGDDNSGNPNLTTDT